MMDGDNATKVQHDPSEIEHMRYALDTLTAKCQRLEEEARNNLYVIAPEHARALERAEHGRREAVADLHKLRQLCGAVLKVLQDAGVPQKCLQALADVPKTHPLEALPQEAAL